VTGADDDEEWTPYEPARWSRWVVAVMACLCLIGSFVLGVFILSNEWPSFERWPHDPWRLLGWFSVVWPILYCALYLVTRYRRKRP
jgi:hypothetical protein